MDHGILVTGAGGFVGGAVLRRLRVQQRDVRGVLRREPSAEASAWPAGAQHALVADLAADTDWRAALHGIDAVVHCAARVHVMRESGSDALAAFRRVNVDGTLALARQAAEAGARRFVFVSSIGVNGAETFERAFTADDAVAPHSPYAQSKHEAEQALRALAAACGLELVIVRPPLVVGPGAPGNFAQLLKALHRRLPLPLGGLRNRRSFVALDNLVDVLLACIDHPAAAGHTLLVSDGEDLSTPALLRRAGAALGTPARLIPVPAALLRGAARLAGRGELAQRLCGSLQVDIDKTQRLLGWAPRVSVDEALAGAARHFLSAQRV